MAIPIAAAIGAIGPTVARSIKQNAPAFVVRLGRTLYIGSAGFLSLAMYTAWKNQNNGHGFLTTLQTGRWKPEDADKPITDRNDKAESKNGAKFDGTEPFPIAELYGPWNDPEDHGTHLHLASEDEQFVIYVGLHLQRMGYRVSEHPRFGGVTRVHTDNSFHYRKRAIDVNHNNQEKEPRKLEVAAAFIRDYANNYNLMRGGSSTVATGR